jgi:RHS repeat-associated protein
VGTEALLILRIDPTTVFGGIWTSSGTAPFVRFPGQWAQRFRQASSDTRIYDNAMRIYAPQKGRYQQVDPLEQGSTSIRMQKTGRLWLMILLASRPVFVRRVTGSLVTRQFFITILFTMAHRMQLALI